MAGNLDETRIDGESVWRGKMLEVCRDRVRLPDGRVLIERQFRYPVGRTFIEFPAGKIDPGETPAQTAARELIEETGWRAGKLAHLTTIHNAIGYSDERIELFVAKDLVREQQRLDAGEFVEVEAVTLDWLLQEVLAGRITDVKTQCGVFWLERLVSGRLAWPRFETP